MQTAAAQAARARLEDRVKTLDQDLTIDVVNGLAHIVQDELENTYNTCFEDPRTGLPSSWMACPAMKVVIAFKQTPKKHHPTTSGTADAYTPPSVSIFLVRLKSNRRGEREVLIIAAERARADHLQGTQLQGGAYS